MEGLNKLKAILSSWNRKLRIIKMSLIHKLAIISKNFTQNYNLINANLEVVSKVYFKE